MSFFASSNVWYIPYQFNFLEPIWYPFCLFFFVTIQFLNLSTKIFDASLKEHRNRETYSFSIGYALNSRVLFVLTRV
jgi:hypothetical protein